MSNPNQNNNKVEEIVPVKAVNLYDGVNMKILIDDAVVRYFKKTGLEEDFTYTDIKLLLGTIACALALLAQFYPHPFPNNKVILILCAIGYFTCTGILQYIASVKVKETIFFSKQINKIGGIVLSSSLPKYEDKYTLTLSFRTPPDQAVVLTKSISSWFDSDGYLREDLLAKDLKNLRKSNPKKTKKVM
eukprot:TRINITY_DN4301_c0_g1_i1.p1 TRINITY_DN4301_c0_g1~~TRINITY_DN4301_c0_g1_i1.p1  ORF type:complete len:189 (-),score=49.65 TRINITY_DN4301_c0_g1_i1:94-660(-)